MKMVPTHAAMNILRVLRAFSSVVRRDTGFFGFLSFFMAALLVLGMVYFHRRPML